MSDMVQGGVSLRVLTRKKHFGYLYEIPLLVMIVALLSAMLWPLVGGPWRLALGVMSGLSVLLLLWYHGPR